MPKLRLGPIPDDKPVKRTITLPAALDGELAAYADAYATEFGQRVPAEKLVVAMLERFLRSDRGFRKARSSGARVPGSQAAGVGAPSTKDC